MEAMVSSVERASIARSMVRVPSGGVEGVVAGGVCVGETAVESPLSPSPPSAAPSAGASACSSPLPKEKVRNNISRV